MLYPQIQDNQYCRVSQYCRIGLASPDQIRAWVERLSFKGELVGRVKHRGTIDYQTQKPERDGLFCERIFGPIRSNTCACGKYRSTTDKSDQSRFCKNCGVEFTDSHVRRHRMGYIALESPIIHPWYLRQRPNSIARLLNQSPKDIRTIAYYDGYLLRPIINKPTLIDPSLAPGLLDTPLDTPFELFNLDDFFIIRFQLYLSEGAFEVFQERELGSGADAISSLLADLNFKTIIDDCRSQIEVGIKLREYSQRKLTNNRNSLLEDEIEELTLDIKRLMREINELYKRCRFIQGFLRERVRPEWMVLSWLPVLPPALRPIIELEDGELIGSDLNVLYKTVISRNLLVNKSKLIYDKGVVHRLNKRQLQQGVDQLFANDLSTSTRHDKNKRAYKSFHDMLKGKHGRFRENLLGKRVDYSGRSVIVAGPGLTLNQCGLPREMAIELFQPFLISALIKIGLAPNIRSAKNKLTTQQPVIWKVLTSLIESHIVILNRAPTLHRLGIQAFSPVLVTNRAIHLHPLVCAGFNADFDGDQMAIHVPLSYEAQVEAWMLLLPIGNLMSPGTGEPITVPSQDMLLGLYVLTLSRGDPYELDHHHRQIDQNQSVQGVKLAIPRFSCYRDVLMAYKQDQVDCDSHLWFGLKSNLLITNTIAHQVPMEVRHDPSWGGLRLAIYENLQIQFIGKEDIMSKEDVINVYFRTTVGRVLFDQQASLGFGSR